MPVQSGTFCGTACGTPCGMPGMPCSLGSKNATKETIPCTLHPAARWLAAPQDESRASCRQRPMLTAHARSAFNLAHAHAVLLPASPHQRHLLAQVVADGRAEAELQRRLGAVPGRHHQVKGLPGGNGGLQGTGAFMADCSGGSGTQGSSRWGLTGRAWAPPRGPAAQSEPPWGLGPGPTTSLHLLHLAFACRTAPLLHMHSVPAAACRVE